MLSLTLPRLGETLLGALLLMLAVPLLVVLSPFLVVGALSREHHRLRPGTVPCRKTGTPPSPGT